MNNNKKTLTERIQSLKERLDIVEVVSREAGIDFDAYGSTAWPKKGENCPCGEHKDNFRISTDGQFANCFTEGCKLKGDVVDFVRLFKGISTSEAVEYLENEYKDELGGDYVS